jgi:hypothetical protein
MSEINNDEPLEITNFNYLSKSSQDSEDDYQTDKDCLLENSYCPDNSNSNLYTVSIDNIPKFYVKDEQSAIEKIWDIGKDLSHKYFLDGYTNNIIKIKDNEIHISGSYQLFLISYEKILSRISYEKISECI